MDAAGPLQPDSPVGLAAWILDKWNEWSGGDLERSFTRGELLTVITLYWATRSIGSSLAPYRDWGLGAPPELAAELYPRALPGVEPTALPPGTRIEVPAAIASFHVRYPRSVAERAYSDLRQWSEMASRSHFPALDDPNAVAADLRRFFRPLRPKARTRR